MNKRFALSLAAALLALPGCGGTGAPANTLFLSDEHALQAVVVEPASLLFSQSGPNYAKTFQALTQFAGDISAVSSNDNCATVNPPSQAVATPPNLAGGAKSATFTVTPVGPGRCTITVTDKKGNTATVTVLFLGNFGN